MNIEVETDPHNRSPLLMNRHDSAVLIIDVQTKLVPHISDNQEMMWNIGRIIEGAAVLELPIAITEQYPKGLGPTHLDLMAKLDSANVIDSTPVFEKTMFSCRECQQLFDLLSGKQVKNVLLVGIETHVCVLQSAMDLMACGFDVFVAIDAVGSRFEEDYMTAMQRMETAGVVLVSTEMALFEWCQKAGTEEFKKISRIVQEEFEELDED